MTLLCAEGYVHARDRFFQMDLTRREVSGDLAEVARPNAQCSAATSRTARSACAARLCGAADALSHQ